MTRSAEVANQITRLLAGFERTIECHCSVDSSKSLSLRYFNKPGLLEQNDKFARHIVLCTLKAIKKLHEQKQPSHQSVVCATPVSDVQLSSWFKNPEYLPCIKIST